MRETAKSISEWIVNTFGSHGSNARVAVRANEEMAELLRAVTDGTGDSKIREECADVVIVLCRLCERYGGDLFEEVDAKMEINRGREWKLDGSGCGYHVKPSARIDVMVDTLDTIDRGNF